MVDTAAADAAAAADVHYLISTTKHQIHHTLLLLLFLLLIIQKLRRHHHHIPLHTVVDNNVSMTTIAAALAIARYKIHGQLQVSTVIFGQVSRKFAQ